jgi:predicted dienelactone hydrolase
MRAATVLFPGLLLACSSTPAVSTDAGATDAVSQPDAGATDAPLATDVVEAPPRDPLTWRADQPGPFRVGYRRWMYTYTPRGTSVPRTIPIHAWYPTLARDGMHPTYTLIFRDPVSIVDAPPAEPVHPGGYPVHVYSHGYQGFGPTSHFLMRYFASHGWLAVAPDHVGNLIGDTPMTLPININYLRSRDVSATLDALDALPAGDPLRGRAVTARAALSGHSFGTHTVWASLGATFDVDAIRARCMPMGQCTDEDLAVFAGGLGDPRFVAGIPMAGAIRREWFGATGHASVRAPLFAMSGTDDRVGADVQYMTATGVDLTWIDVRGGCHQYFALGGCANIPDAEQGPIVGTYALAFARKHVLRDADAAVGAILDGTTRLSDRVTFQRRTP